LAERPPIWPVFVTYAAAFVAIVALSVFAAGAVRALYPDLPESAVFEGLPGLLAGGIAASAGLLLTVLVANRGTPLAGLRLVPGRETGRTLVVMVVGMLALGQALDSLTMLVGLGQQGSMVAIRRALAQAVGPDLFLAVLVIGVLAGSAEEVFFRGYMQTRLGKRLPPVAAIVVTSLCFGVLHLEWLHALLAFALGLYLGWITELAGSALPALACHVINNALFTILTALWGTLEGFGLNAALVAVSSLAFAGCVVWLRHAPPAPAATNGPRVG
jgi:membrane protease YdiL (CAAX protease family)